VERKKPGRKTEPKRRIAWRRWTGFRGKTVWAWLQLLVVPLALAVIGLWFAAQQDARQLEHQQEQHGKSDTAREGFRTVHEGIYCDRKQDFQKGTRDPMLASEVESRTALYGSA
jgi:hypothetical protein